MIEQRWDELLDIEAAIVAALPIRAALHYGVVHLMPGNVALQRYLQTASGTGPSAVQLPAAAVAACTGHPCLQGIRIPGAETPATPGRQRENAGHTGTQPTRQRPDTAANSALRTALKHLPAANASGESPAG